MPAQFYNCPTDRRPQQQQCRGLPYIKCRQFKHVNTKRVTKMYTRHNFQLSVLCLNGRKGLRRHLHFHRHTSEPKCCLGFKFVFLTNCHSYIDCALGCEHCPNTHECTATVIWLSKLKFIVVPTVADKQACLINISIMARDQRSSQHKHGKVVTRPCQIRIYAQKSAPASSSACCSVIL